MITILSEPDDVIKIKLLSENSSQSGYTSHDFEVENSKGKIVLVMDKNSVLVEVKVHGASNMLPRDFFDKSENQYSIPPIEYFEKEDVLYLSLNKNKEGKIKSTYPFNPSEVGAEINLDLDHEGRILGIEIFGASKHMPKELLDESA